MHSPVRAVIEFKNIEFDYVPGKLVLHDVSVRVEAGESVALVGKSGAGKSSFVNLIPRFYDPVFGVIHPDGVDVRDLRIHDLRDHIGYVPQMPMLFNASIANNIRAGKQDASDEEVLQAARDANAHEFIEQFNQGFDTVLSERGNSLSGGQCQRIAIARAFLKNAPILVFGRGDLSLGQRK